MLTLPPVIGRKYYYLNTEDNKKYTCRIIETDKCRDSLIYRSQGKNHRWAFWPDGEAKINGGNSPPVAILLADVDLEGQPEPLKTPSNDEDIAKLHAKRDAMKARLQELGAG